MYQCKNVSIWTKIQIYAINRFMCVWYMCRITPIIPTRDSHAHARGGIATSPGAIHKRCKQTSIILRCGTTPLRITNRSNENYLLEWCTS